MRSLISKYASWIGSTIALLSICYVGYQLSKYGEQVDLHSFSNRQWAFFGLLAVVYGSANLFLALAWQTILVDLSAFAPRITAIKIYGLSQLAKYLPGNIFHLAGRQALGLSQGIAGVALAKSAIWELGLIASTGVLFSTLVIPFFYPTLTDFWSVVIFIVCVALAGWLLNKFFSKNILIAYLYYFLFLITSGAIFATIISIAASGQGELHYCYIAAAFVIAWLAGLVTPGSPAGIGVRELVLLYLLKSVVAETDILLSVIIGRLITVVGDMLFYIFAMGVISKRDGSYS